MLSIFFANLWAMSLKEHSYIVVQRVELKQHVDKISDDLTPHSYLDNAAFYFERDDGAKASEMIWECSSLQLKYFLIGNELDANGDRLRIRIIDFLTTFCTDKELKDQLFSAWPSVHLSQENAHDYKFGLGFVKYMLKSAMVFCNVLYEINERKSFNRDDLLNWLPDYLMLKVKVPIDGEWKMIEEWIHEGKLKLEGEKPNMRLIKL
ncbi:hypothetical protein ACQ4LE_010308 [Meloidogyne hapla]|uniref:W2 domain-containing protein n=1 Tax=Meloidogyne hapla TaxID=6305 RepID=A0A1I8C347_MELHA